MTSTGDRLQQVYDKLYREYGPQHWWPGEGPFEIIVSAILTQQTTWTNVEKALANLREAGALSPDGLWAIEERDLARMLRPSGYFNAKARKLKAFADLLHERFGGNLRAMLARPARELRTLLLATHGIGPETADSILLYAAGRPVFVIDTYTRRLFSRLGIEPNSHKYDGWQTLFMESLPADAQLFNDYHALIVRHGKEVCRTAPRCGACPLAQVCATGQRIAPAARSEPHAYPHREASMSAISESPL